MRTGFYFLLLLMTMLIAQGAAAYDQQVLSTLWAEGYSVPGRDGSPIRRRRFVEDLRLGAWNLMPGSDHPYYRGLRLSIEVELRLDTDFAIGKNESKASSRSAYVPGLAPVNLDAMVAYVNMQGLWNDSLDIRAGRQIRIDPLGFFAFDGVETKLHFPGGLGLDAYIGAEVLGADTLGWDSLGLGGTDKGGRNGMEADRYPYRINPDKKMILGTQLSLMPWSWLDALLDFRTVGVSSNLADARLAGQLIVGDKPLRGNVRVVYSPVLDSVAEADADIAISIADILILSAEYSLYRPIFESDSIFNVFDLASQNDLGGRVQVNVGERVSLAGWAFAHMAEGSAGLSGNENNSLLAGVGGGFGGDYRTIGRTLSARFSALQEWGEQRIGGELAGEQALLRGNQLKLGIRISLWHIDDDFSETFSGNLAGYIASLKYQIDDGVELLAEFEHYAGNQRAQRFYALGLLRMDLWR